MSDDIKITIIPGKPGTPGRPEERSSDVKVHTDICGTVWRHTTEKIIPAVAPEPATPDRVLIECSRKVAELLHMLSGSITNHNPARVLASKFWQAGVMAGLRSDEGPHVTIDGVRYYAKATTFEPQ